MCVKRVDKLKQIRRHRFYSGSAPKKMSLCPLFFTIFWRITRVSLSLKVRAKRELERETLQRKMTITARVRTRRDSKEDITAPLRRRD